MEAIIALPLNIFYGAGVPACLLILNKNRTPARSRQVPLAYAARSRPRLRNRSAKVRLQASRPASARCGTMPPALGGQPPG